MAPRARMTVKSPGALARRQWPTTPVLAGVEARGVWAQLGGLSTAEYDLLLESAHRSAEHHRLLNWRPRICHFDGQCRAVGHLRTSSTTAPMDVRPHCGAQQQSARVPTLQTRHREINRVARRPAATQQARMVLTGIPLGGRDREAKLPGRQC